MKKNKLILAYFELSNYYLNCLIINIKLILRIVYGMIKYMKIN